MQKTLKEIAQLIGGEIVGDEQAVITGICGLKEARQGDITFLANTKYLPLLDTTAASAIITSRDIQSAVKPIIRTDNPSLAFAKVIALLMPKQLKSPQGVHSTAQIGAKVRLGKDVGIGAYAVIEDDVIIGDRSIIYAGCYIGWKSSLGSDTVIYPRVTVREQVSIGDRVVINSGAVIGSDGFGFVAIDGVYQRVPQVGTVVIEDDVEIGSNVTIDRARFDRTLIGRGTKIDNLVQIGHNVVIGKHSIIVAQAGVAGSTKVGDQVTVAGQAGLVGHITVGDGAVIAAQAGVTKSVPAHAVVSGYPAQPHAKAIEINACVQNLPRIHKTIIDLKKRVSELEDRLTKG